MRFTFSLLLIIFSSAKTAHSQSSRPGSKSTMKGKMYFYWGWNRSTYTKSDIHFHGSNFDFTVKQAVAKDRQSPFGVDPYFTINQITIPQYNYRLGYYISNRYNISFGFDHMKYVMVQDQVVKVTGVINDVNSVYSGTYDNTDVAMAGNFLQFEHTDGLNYVNTELNRVDHLYTYKKIDLRSTAGIGAGVMAPRTRAVVLDNPVNDQWHVSGYGISVKAGLNVSFYNHFFIQGELKGGYINMPDIVIEANSGDRASQHFDFVQANVVFGYQFSLVKS